MQKAIKLLIICLIGLATTTLSAKPLPESMVDPIYVSATCTLPPPASVTVSNITTTSADISWSAVVGAVMYKVSLYDATSAVYLPDIYTASTSITASGLEPGHNIDACVSAYSCLEGDGGSESCVSFVTETIIITEIILDRPSCGQYNISNSVATINLPKAVSGAGVANAAKVVVCRRVGMVCSTNVIEFNMYADCFGQVVFYQEPTEDTELMRLPSIATVCSDITYKYVLNGDLYFSVGNVKEVIDHDDISYDVDITLNNGIPNGRINYCMENITIECVEEGQQLTDSGDDKIRLTPEIFRPVAQYLHTSPNPFSNGLQAQYYLAKAGPATLSLLDLNGHVLHAIQKGPDTPAGRHFAAFTDLDNLPSGIYLLQLQTDYQQQTVLVVKQP